jgi:hypothetical protein
VRPSHDDKGLVESDGSLVIYVIAGGAAYAGLCQVMEGLRSLLRRLAQPAPSARAIRSMRPQQREVLMRHVLVRRDHGRGALGGRTTWKWGQGCVGSMVCSTIATMLPWAPSVSRKLVEPLPR